MAVGPRARALAGELATLNVAAGRPTLDRIVNHCKINKVTAKDATLSNWFNGISVPRSKVTFSLVIGFLNGCADSRTPDYQRLSFARWEEMRLAAQQEHRAKQGRRSAPGDSDDTKRQSDSLNKKYEGMPSQARADLFSRNCSQYIAVLNQRFRRIDLEVLAPSPAKGTHPEMLLEAVFVPQLARADVPHIEISAELRRELMESAHWRARDLPSYIDEDEWAAVSKLYRFRSPEPVLMALSAEENKRIVILAEPGLGKTSLAKYFFLSIASQFEFARFDYPINTLYGPEMRHLRGILPVWVSLGTYIREGSSDFLDYLDSQYLDEHCGIPRDQLVGYLNSGGRAVFIFDGLDEVFDAGLRERTTRQIEGFGRKFEDVRIIVTSRPIGYRKRIFSDAKYAHFTLQQLTRAQISEFSRKWMTAAHVGNVETAVAAETAFLNTLDRYSSQQTAELATNPMLLTILASAAWKRGLPHGHRRALEHAINILIDVWDTSKGIEDSQSLRDLLNRDDKVRLLHRAARSMSNHADLSNIGNHCSERILVETFRNYVRDELHCRPDEAVQISRSILAGFRTRNSILAHFGAGVYGFIHRSFLEYIIADDMSTQLREGEIDKQKVIAIFEQRSGDPEWQEVLKLLADMLPERLATECVLPLIQRGHQFEGSYYHTEDEGNYWDDFRLDTRCVLAWTILCRAIFDWKWRTAREASEAITDGLLKLMELSTDPGWVGYGQYFDQIAHIFASLTSVERNDWLDIPRFRAEYENGLISALNCLTERTMYAMGIFPVWINASVLYLKHGGASPEMTQIIESVKYFRDRMKFEDYDRRPTSESAEIARGILKALENFVNSRSDNQS
ncbi:NACHT domain-containing protein [Nocardia fluminea]|uniref:NACHT domain-containing protein n=1 Tax=Nocardia fluminea TaxID=134984 RepID=A0A2N3WYE9_9NOCA|nr:NACHT domain-containing protein [Nocardia fluminea]PKV98896.1 NACHT domain-containing protein [Nocardia fluminea]